MRASGIEAVGDIPWGTHLCQFYDTSQDLLEILVPYFREGLKSNELCIWITSGPLTVEQAAAALGGELPDLDQYIKRGQIEILDYGRWFTRSGKFSPNEAFKGWVDKLSAALEQGYEGLRLTGNTFWLEHSDWNDSTRYEEMVNNVIGQYQMLAICTYCLGKCGAMEAIDVVSNHQFSLIKSRGKWEIIESTQYKKTEASLREKEIKYRTVADNTYDWEFWLDPEGRFIYCSPSCERITGHKAEEFYADPDLRSRIIHPNDRPQFEKHLREIEHKQQGVSEAEWRYIRPDGSCCWVAHICQPVYDDSGRFLGTRGSNRNITERKQAEEMLTQNKQKFEILSETASQLLQSKNPQEIINTLCNKVMKHLDCQVSFNYLLDEKENKLHLNACEGIPAEAIKTIERLELGQAVCGCVARDGKRIVAENIQETKDPMFDLVRSFGIKAYTCHPLMVAGKVIGTLSFGTSSRTRFSEEDLEMMKIVTDHVATAMERMRFEEQIKTLAKFPEENPSQVLRISGDGKIIYSNKPGTVLLEQWGRKVGDQIPENYHKLITDSLASNRYRVEEIRCGEKIFSFVIAPIVEGGYVNLYGRDVTTLKKTEDELRKSKDELEIRVKQRTSELTQVVDILRTEIERREHAEQATKTERQRLNDVLETLPAYVILLSGDYHVPFANRFFRERFGESHGLRCFEYLFGRCEPCENCETYKVLKTNKPHHWEWTGPDGRNYDIFDFPFTDTDGSRLIMEMGIDITEQKRAQEQSRSASIYARSLIEASLDPLVTISADGKITDVNEATIKVTGVPRDKIIGTDFSIYFTEPQKAREGYQQVFARGFVTDYPLTIRHKEGRLTDVLYNATVYKDTHDNVVGVFAAARDVTAQKQASQYARSLIEASLDPLVTISADGKITDVNEATIKVTGVPRDKIIGTDFSIYFTEPQKAREGYQQVFARGFVTDYPLTIRHKEGRLTDVLYNATVYKDTHDNVVGVFAAARDITERKSAEKRQSITNLLLELFAKEISRKKYLDSAVKVIRDWSGCEFVGIRIRDIKGNIPYESYVGFDQEFLALENALNLQNDNCVCIRAILQQSQKQEKTFMTDGGSFYCNDSQAFLNRISEQKRKEYRDNCICWGFQSIAVIPIRYREEARGVIHIADKWKNKTPKETVEFLENMAILIGEAVHRFDTETALRMSESRLVEAQRIANLGNWNWDIVSNILSWSDEVYRIFGRAPQEFGATYEAFLSFVHPDDRELVKRAVNDAIYARKYYSIDHRIIRPDGVERIIHERAEVTYDENQNPVRMMGTIQDVTEQKKIEEKILADQKLLRSLTSKLELAQEAERRRIAADLHDSIGQIMAFSVRELQTLQQKTPKQTARTLQEIRGQLEQAIQQTRTLTFNLSPSTLYDLGFEIAVEELAERFTKERKIQCYFENSPEPKPLADDVKIFLYRSIRELLINVAKHANARSVLVSLTKADDDIQITIKDNGQGFDASLFESRMTKANGFGIFNIRERLAHIGGGFEIKSGKGKGTTVTLRAPLNIKKTKKRIKL